MSEKNNNTNLLLILTLGIVLYFMFKRDKKENFTTSTTRMDKLTKLRYKGQEFINILLQMIQQLLAQPNAQPGVNKSDRLNTLVTVRMLSEALSNAVDLSVSKRTVVPLDELKKEGQTTTQQLVNKVDEALKQAKTFRQTIIVVSLDNLLKDAKTTLEQIKSV